MTSTNNRKSLTDMPPPAAFSYAQAAKGMAAPPAASSQPSRASSGSITPAKDSVASLPAVMSELPAGTSWADDGDHLVNGSISSMEVAVSQSSESTIMPTAATRRASIPQTNGLTSPGSPEFGMSSVSTLPREDDQSSAPVPSSESTWESKSQSSIQDKGMDAVEPANDKEKEKEKGRRKKDKAPPLPKPVLQEAPIPAVNIWKQRAEQKKVKPAVSSASPTAKALPPGPSISTANSFSQPTASEANSGAEQEPKVSSKIVGEDKIPRVQRERSADDSPRARRSSRSRDKPDRAAMSAPLPSLGDSESWPTPVIAQDEEQKRSQGKTEKVPEKDRTNGAPGASKAKTNWVSVPITPTVVFNTPLPNTGARRGGRGGGRGGRDGGGRGGSSSGRPPREDNRGDSSLPALPNGETSGRRGRPQESGHSTSPSRPKRGPSNEGQTRRESKTRAVPRETLVKEEFSTADAPLQDATPPTEGGAVMQEANGANTTTMRNNARLKQSRRQEWSTTSFDKRREHEAGGAVAGAENGSHLRRASVAGVTQGGGEHKEAAARDFVDNPDDDDAETEEKKRGSFDMSTSVRNPTSERRAGPYNTYPNRERPDRGRGGMRRGHGFHPGSGHQFGNGFTGPHGPSSLGYFHSPGFQNAYFGQVPPHQRYGRGGTSRTQSIPSESLYGRFANGYPAVQTLPHIQTGYMGAGMYGDYTQMYPMTAVPFNVHVDTLTVSHMVATQL
jgi:la-related protein 1